MAGGAHGQPEEVCGWVEGGKVAGLPLGRWVGVPTGGKNSSHHIYGSIAGEGWYRAVQLHRIQYSHSHHFSVTPAAGVGVLCGVGWKAALQCW